MWTFEDLVRRVEARTGTGARRLLGITGPPGCGKSTLAARLAAAVRPAAVVVPMDGYHLANAELRRLGRHDRKGAADTFDAAGYVALLHRLRARESETVYAPEFDRDLEEPIAGAIPVPPDVPLVITEGNYLLLDEEPWSRLRGLLDEVHYLEQDPRVRVERLIRRHIGHGMAPERARAWADGPDSRNAELIEATRHRADFVLPPFPDGPEPAR